MKILYSIYQQQAGRGILNFKLYMEEKTVDKSERSEYILNHKLMIFLTSSACFAVLTYILSTCKNDQYVIHIISTVFSFCFSGYAIIKLELLDIVARANWKIKVLSLTVGYCSIDIIRRRFYSDGPQAISGLFRCSIETGNYVYLVLIAISFLAIFSYYIYLFDFLYKVVVKEIFLTLSQKERIYFISFVSIMIIIAVGAHLSNSGFDYGRFLDKDGNIITNEFNADAMMDCDSLATQWQMRHFDFLFRHPMFAESVLPEYSFARAVGILFPHMDQGVMLILSIMNIIRLGVCGICIARLAHTEKVLPFYLCSFPVIIYGLVIERHTWMTFWNVLMVYLVLIYYKKNKDYKIDYMPVYQAGATNLTGVIIAIPVLIERKHSLVSFVKSGVGLALSFLALIITTGNLGCIIDLPQQITSNMNFIRMVGIWEKLVRFTNAIEGCFGGVKIQYHSYYVTFYDESQISIMGIIITLIIVIAAVKLHKNSFARICSFWLLFAFVMFPIAGFSFEDFSMHMILFSWATISLVIMFGEKLYMEVKNKWIKKGIAATAGVLLLWQFATNYVTITELLSYAMRFNYVS